MLFEPCGDLRKDYGAYCETLRLTEREEVYSAINTTEELQQMRLAKQRALIEEENGPAKEPTPEEVAAAEEAAAAAIAAAAAAAAAAAEAQAAEEKNAQPKNKGRKPSRKGTAPKEVEAVPAPEELPTQPQPSLTLISLRHPKFCINQRDITPLCRAIPHCPTLVSVQLVGCGLSVDSYMRLVEAVFKSPRVVTVRVDFNSLTQPGFFTDPTVLVPPSPSATVIESAAGEGPFAADKEAAAAAEAPPAEAEPPVVTPPSTGRGGRPRSTSASKGGRRSSKKPSKEPMLATDTISQLPPDEPGAIYLKPGEYCGLHLLPTALSEQIREEKEKRGKIDAKKAAQLQVQQEAIQQFNLTHRLKLPRGWEGMAYTGIQSLCLRGNGIDDAAAKDLIAAITHNPQSQLHSLNLWGNAITDVGASRFAGMLKTNRTLRALDLGRNRISDVGMLEIIDTFRMMEMTTTEAILSYRQRVLTRPSASNEERTAASQQMFNPLPSYADLYQAWYATAHPPAPEEQRAKEGGKRATQSKNKGRSEAPPTLVRPSLPFDCHCLRLHPASSGDPTVRVPGNTALEVLNLGENPLITLNGVREVLRRLSLREPKTDEEMVAMTVNPNPPSPAGEDAGPAVLSPTVPAPKVMSGRGHATPALPTVYPPELHCEGLRLRACVVSAPKYTAEDEWAEIAELQRAITRVLDSFAPSVDAPEPVLETPSGTPITKGSSRRTPSSKK